VDEIGSAAKKEKNMSPMHPYHYSPKSKVDLPSSKPYLENFCQKMMGAFSSKIETQN
jgi:hypothetical protein